MKTNKIVPLIQACEIRQRYYNIKGENTEVIMRRSASNAAFGTPRLSMYMHTYEYMDTRSYRPLSVFCLCEQSVNSMSTWCEFSISMYTSRMCIQCLQSVDSVICLFDVSSDYILCVQYLVYILQFMSNLCVNSCYWLLLLSSRLYTAFAKLMY